MIQRKLQKRTLLKGGTILDPFHQKEFKGDVFIENGKIAGIGKIHIEDTNVIDCHGQIITHGFCDLHVHFREPGREDKETLETGSKAAMAGGFTRVCVMPNTHPPIDSPESVRFIVEKSQNCSIYIHPIGAATKGQLGKELTEMAGMAQEGAVAFSDDGLSIMDGAMMRRVLEYGGMVDKPIINHAEDDFLRNGGLMNEGLMSTRLGLRGNPVQSEAVMVYRDLELAKLTRARLHVPHVSTRLAVEHIENIKKEIAGISSEVTPHHLFFTDEDLIHYDTQLKVAPPIRSQEDREWLIKGLKTGVIDCIATDHAPHTIEEKESTFDLAAFGMIGLESCLGAVVKVLFEEAEMDWVDIIRLITVNPRNIMGFDPDLFSIKTPVELVVIDPEEIWRFSRKDIFSKSINSPFIGRSLKGRVKAVLAKNHILTL